MEIIDINANWVVKTTDEIECDLPFDALYNTQRDYSCALGDKNGYYPAAQAVFTRALPAVKGDKVKLVIAGACGYGDVFVNGGVVGKLTSYAPTEFDITDKLISSHNELRIEMFSSPAMADKYIGLGIASGIKLVVQNDVDLESGSLFVKTVTLGDKTFAEATVTIVNNGPAQKFVLECTATNARGKRAGKKQRKVYLRANATKAFSVRVRLSRPYEWTNEDPYVYGMTARLIADGNEISADCVKFGLATYALNHARGLYINNKNTVLVGAYVSHADAAVGGVCNYSNELRRLSALKKLGYNAVHFVTCPGEAALDALDELGMYAFVDIFGVLGIGKAPLDAHAFGVDYESVTVSSVKALRNHPCVVMYGVGDDLPECYNRGDGHELIGQIARVIREIDPTRPITVSAREFVPTVAELEKVGVKRHFETDEQKINAGREKQLYETLTFGAFDNVDVCGFNYLDQLYATEKIKHGRLVVGSRTKSERAFKSINDAEKTPHVIGDFNECGIDYPGGGHINEHHCTLGDLDAICDIKPVGMHKSIVLGTRGKAYITAVDPDTGEVSRLWNWPRFLGQQITVKVYTSGDVVALYLDGRLLGRKLAGKINSHIATFNVEYYPGKLEAICYYKGFEHARDVLKSAASPKSVKLEPFTKSLLLSRGDLGFVHVDVCDKEGNIVPYAMRELNATVTGGEIVSFINADPLLRKRTFDTCPAYGGKALLVVRPDKSEDRMLVKVGGEGLLSSKLTFKIKD
ncbi:MAG: DUF4982 domain-containing protein [Clostridiales bacterium]|nr:DUF4982 domain-containing protein [Clostridiales bacterium]